VLEQKESIQQRLAARRKKNKCKLSHVEEPSNGPDDKKKSLQNNVRTPAPNTSKNAVNDREFTPIFNFNDIYDGENPSGNINEISLDVGGDPS
jgi:hypothetical protein